MMVQRVCVSLSMKVLLFVILVALCGFNSSEGQTNSPSASVTQSATSTKIKVVELNGAQFLKFDFTSLPDEYVETAINGSFAFLWVTNKPNGLIWHQTDLLPPKRTMFFAMERGRLLFVVKYPKTKEHPNGDAREVVIGAKSGVRFDNSRWHQLNIARTGRNIELTVDGKNTEHLTFPESDNLHSQFLVKSNLNVGGARNVSGLTDGRVTENFVGEIGAFVYSSAVVVDNRIAKSIVSLIAEVEDRPDLTVKAIDIHPERDYQLPTKPKVTAVTIRDPGSYLLMPNVFEAKPTSTLAIQFQTVKPQGVVMYTTHLSGDKYLMMELYDGNLYLVSKFGKQAQRTLLLKNANDRMSHQVSLTFGTRRISATVDGETTRITLPAKDTLPQKLGPIYLASVPNLESLPWHTWAREGYMGCLVDVTIDGEVQDLAPSIANQIRTLAQFNRIDQECTAMPPTCVTRNPCRRKGKCVTHWDKQTCDCRNTDYTGETCETPSTTALFDGKTFLNLNFRPQQSFHADDISFRFKAISRDGLIFQTDARGDDNYINAELEDGQLVINTRLGDRPESMAVESLRVGSDLNDNEFHTVIIERRADNITVFIDGNPKGTGFLPGEGFFHDVDEVFIGGYDKPDIVNALDAPVFFTGYIRNFNLGDYNIIKEVKDAGKPGNFFEGSTVPALIFSDVTVPTYNTHTCLPAVGSVSSMDMSLSFKTFEENGVLLFSSGNRRSVNGRMEPNGILFVVELFNGNLYVKLNNPGRGGIDVRAPQTFNDGKWHTLTVRAQEDQMVVSVDNGHSVHGYQGLNRLRLDGPVCVGGIPTAYFGIPKVQSFVSSRHGYRGCLASFSRDGTGVDLHDLGKSDGMLDKCQAIKSKCTKDTCNGGICHDNLNNGTTWCDCSKTGLSGAQCIDEPDGYYIHKEGLPSKCGAVVYSFPPEDHRSFDSDEIVFGLMTDQLNGAVARLESATHTDFVQFSVKDGFMTVSYDTEGKGSPAAITNRKVNAADAQYHVIKFLRQANNASLIVDSSVASIKHPNSHDNFKRLGNVFIGVVNVENDNINCKAAFRGIVGGLNINGRSIFRFVKRGLNSQTVGDVVVAQQPFRLVDALQPVAPGVTRRPTTTTQTINWVIVTDPPYVVPVTQERPVYKMPVVPAGVGGAGIQFVPGQVPVNVVMFPKGSAGTVYNVNAPPPLIGANGEQVVGAATGLSLIPLMPKEGPRAGALMGIILGIMVGLSSLMWAFYLCKPGCCCGSASDAMAISSPDMVDMKPLIAPAIVEENVYLTKTKAPSFAGSDVGGGSIGGGGSINETKIERHIIHNNYHIDNADMVDSAFMSGHNTMQMNHMNNMNNMNTMNTMNTHNTHNTNGMGYRHNSTGGYSMSDRQHLLGVNTISRVNRLHSVGNNSDHSFNPGESTTADYDIATGVHNSGDYKGSTLRVNQGMRSGHSTSTLGSNYNYNMTVKNTRQNTMGYSQANMIVTPGPMGEEVRVDCCLMTHDGKSVVTGSSLGPPQVWNLADGELLRIMQGETVGCTSLQLLCDQRLLIGAINSDLEINSYSMPKGVHNYVFQIWDFEGGLPLMGAEPEICSAVCIMSDQDKVVFGRTDIFGGGTNVIVWDLMANQSLKEMRYDAPVGNNDYLSFLRVSQNDRFAVAGFTNSFDNQAEFVVLDMTLTSYSIIDPVIMRLDADPSVTAMLPSDEVVTGLRSGELVIWSLKGLTSRQLKSYSSPTAHDSEVKALACSDNNQYLVSASADGTLKLWDLQSERLMATLQGHRDEVWCCTISSDNEVITSGSRDGNIRLWKLRSGQEICAFNAGVDVFHIAMSQDRGTIVALGDKYGARKLIMLQVVRSKVKRQVLA